MQQRPVDLSAFQHSIRKTRNAVDIFFYIRCRIGYLGFLLGPPVIGYIAEAFGLSFSFMLMAIGGIAINQLVKRIEI